MPIKNCWLCMHASVFHVNMIFSISIIKMIISLPLPFIFNNFTICGNQQIADDLQFAFHSVLHNLLNFVHEWNGILMKWCAFSSKIAYIQSIHTRAYNSAHTHFIMESNRIPHDLECMQIGILCGAQIGGHLVQCAMCVDRVQILFI